jgi:excisionase family DNA binding protein
VKTKKKQYTTHDVGQLLEVDPSTISKWIDRGWLEAFRTPGGHRRVRLEDLLAFLAEHDMPVPVELRGRKLTFVVVDDEKAALDAVRRTFRPFAETVDILPLLQVSKLAHG